MIHKKILIIAVLVTSTMLLQSYMPRHDDDKPVNLQILPKDISEHELHQVMREYSRALGVRCGFCHVSQKVEGQERPKFDFASDDKPEKKNAREMMLMVNAVNKTYLAKLRDGDRPFEQITCVSCHMGRTRPIVSVDSLAKPTQTTPH